MQRKRGRRGSFIPIKPENWTRNFVLLISLRQDEDRISVVLTVMFNSKCIVILGTVDLCICSTVAFRAAH